MSLDRSESVTLVTEFDPHMVAVLIEAARRGDQTVHSLIRLAVYRFLAHDQLRTDSTGHWSTCPACGTPVPSLPAGGPLGEPGPSGEDQGPLFAREDRDLLPAVREAARTIEDLQAEREGAVLVTEFEIVNIVEAALREGV